MKQKHSSARVSRKILRDSAFHQAQERANREGIVQIVYEGMVDDLLHLFVRPCTEPAPETRTNQLAAVAPEGA